MAPTDSRAPSMSSRSLPLQYGDTVSLWLEDERGHVWADGHVDGRCSVRTLHSSFRGALFELESTSHARGTVVRGGERLHLRHVRSQRLLTTRPHSGSVVEPNNLRVELSSEEDDTGQAVFVPLPIYPARPEAPLQSDEQLLELGWAPVGAVEQLLHASAALMPTSSAAEPVRELNCAAAGSRWRLRLYARHAPLELLPVALRCGQAVRVQFIEGGELLVPGGGTGAAGAAAVARACPLEAAGSRSLWEVEGLDCTLGGELRWGGAFRLRHADSGALLCADAASASLVVRSAAGAEGDERSSRLVLEAEATLELAAVAGRARAVHRAHRNLRGAPSRGRAPPAAGEAGVDAHAPPAGALRWACAAPGEAAWLVPAPVAIAGGGGGRRGAAAGGEAGEAAVMLAQARDEASAVRLLPVAASELAVAEYVPSALRWVRQFAALVRSGRRVHEAHAAVAAAVLRGLLRLAHAHATAARATAQRVLAEHGALEAAAELLRSPAEAGVAAATMASAQPGLAGVLRRAHALLAACALGAPRDTPGITPRQRAELVARVGLRLGGTSALRAMLSGCAREEEARGWAALLLHEAEAEETPKRPAPLVLLTSLCVSPSGTPNPAGQAALAAELFSSLPRRAARVLLTLRADAGMPRTPWDPTADAPPPPGAAAAPQPHTYEAAALDSRAGRGRGLPGVQVSWQGEPRPPPLFGCGPEGPLEAVAAPLALDRAAAAAEAAAEAVGRREVALTLEAQLRLMAAACTGPSGGGAVAAVRGWVPLEVCLGCARQQRLGARLRASFVALLHAAHVAPALRERGAGAPADLVVWHAPPAPPPPTEPLVLVHELVRGHLWAAARAARREPGAARLTAAVLRLASALAGVGRGGEGSGCVRGPLAAGLSAEEAELLGLSLQLLHPHAARRAAASASAEPAAGAEESWDSEVDDEDGEEEAGGGDHESQSGLEAQPGGSGAADGEVAAEACALALLLLRRAEGAQVSRVLVAMREAMERGAEAAASPGAAPRALEAALGTALGAVLDSATAGPGAAAGIDAAARQQLVVLVCAGPPAASTGALQLLAWAHTRRARLVARLARLQLLGDETAATLHAEVAPRLAALRSAAAAAPRWRSLGDPSAFATLQRVQAELGHLEELAAAPNGPASLGGAAALVACGAVEACVAVLAVPLRPEPEPAEKPQHAHLAATARLACRALAALCRAAAAAQSALFPHAARLVPSLWLGAEAFALLDALFGGRPDLCARAPTALLRALAADAFGPRRSAPHARALASLALAGVDTPVRSVQWWVVQRAERAAAQAAMAGEAPLFLRRQEPTGGATLASAEGLAVRGEGGDDALVARLELLGACCQGRHLEAEAKSQLLCPLPVLVPTLCSFRSPPPLRRALARLLHAAYVETEAPTPGLRSSEHMLHVLQHFKEEVEGLADLMPDPDAQPPAPPPPAALEAQRDVVYTGVLPCLLAYLRSVSAAARAEARLPEAQHGAGLLLSSAILALYRAEARSAWRRLQLGRVLFAVRQLGLPPSQFDAEQLASLEAAAAAEGEGEAPPAAAAPAAESPPEVCLAAWQRELGSHDSTAAAVRAEAGALVPMLRSQGAEGSGVAAAALVRMAVGAAGENGDAAVCICTLRLLRRVVEGGGRGLTAATTEALAGLLVQLLAEQRVEAVSEADSDTEEGEGETSAGGSAIGGGSLELEALRLLVAALKADGDGGGHRGGLLHDALAAALAARPRDAAACRRAMVHWLQRGIACAHALGEELSEVAASTPQLEPPDAALLAALATDGEARVAEEHDGAAVALELLRLTLRSLRLMARHAGLLAFVLGSPPAATAAPPTEPELLEPLANCVGSAVQHAAELKQGPCQGYAA